ncbi:hypothetical protein BZZ01_23985 [Nostocales cyanobacterium HT-58-2]|nr:hypothetical protein BZZ01_23985 [Nostocales cyanobacterium HT-58-2]
MSIPVTDSVAEWTQALKSQNLKYLRFEFPDLHGVSRSKLIPINHVESYTRKGLNLYGGTLGLDTASLLVSESGLHQQLNFRDGVITPDLETLTPIPWLENTAKVICDPEWSFGVPIRSAPRYVLKMVLQEAADLGFDVLMGHEFEFYLLDKETRAPLFDGVHVFNTTRNQYLPIIDQLLSYLEESGIDVITHNSEYGPSQMEINYAPAIGMKAADRAFTFKNAVKEVCHRAGYLATFMAKPFTENLGCGCHVHICLLNRETGQNAFLDLNDKDGLSVTAKAFIQGILDHGPAMMPLMSPTPNCYRRYLPPSFVSSYSGWGIEDRSAMVRVKATYDECTHIEMRAASSISNPYLSAAATIAAGLLGIKQKRELQPPIQGQGLQENLNHQKLPQTLEEALDAITADADMQEMLGDELVRIFCAVKRSELARFYRHVTDWEKNEYMEIY